MQMDIASSFYFDVSRDQMSWELFIFIFFFASFVGLIVYGILVCLGWLTLVRFCFDKFLGFGIYIIYLHTFICMNYRFFEIPYELCSLLSTEVLNSYTLDILKCHRRDALFLCDG